MSKKKIIAICVVSVFVIGALAGGDDENSSSSTDVATESTANVPEEPSDEPSDEPSEEPSEEENVSSNSDAPTQKENKSKKKEKKSEENKESEETDFSESAPDVPDQPDSPHRSGLQDDGATIIGVSDKDVDELNLTFYESVPEDVTGDWRMAIVYDDCDIRDYIFSYYKKYIEPDDGTHIIVNPVRGITTRINPIGSFAENPDDVNLIIVTELSYVPDEEKSAKDLCCGDVKCEYFVFCDNGDIEEF